MASSDRKINTSANVNICTNVDKITADIKNAQTNTWEQKFLHKNPYINRADKEK